MESQTYEITSSSADDGGNTKEIRIEIQPNDGDPMEHNTIHTIQLQSPGGSSHFVEGLVVTTTSQDLPQNHTRMAFAHGGTIIVENDDGVLHDNTNITLSEDGETEQIICGPGIQVVSLATNENGETIFLLPKQDSSSMVVLESGHESVSSENGLPMKQITLPSNIHQRMQLASSSLKQPQQTLMMVTEHHHQQQQTVVKQEVVPVSNTVGVKPPERPKRKAALKAIAARKTAKKKREKYAADKQDNPVKSETVVHSAPRAATPELITADISMEEETTPEKSPEKGKSVRQNSTKLSLVDTSSSFGKNDMLSVEEEYASSTDDEDIPSRRCVVCLRHRRFTEDIFDSSKQLYYHIDVLIAHLNIQVKGTPSNTGLCPECMNHLQRWHIFNCAIAKRQDMAKTTGAKVVEEALTYQTFESRVYKNYKKMARVKEVFHSATHAQYARRHLNEKDWDFFCDHLFHSNSVKSEKSKELEKFLTSREKLSKLYCLACNKLISNGKRGFTKHMQDEHQQSPVLYPCDICGNTFPEKDMTASTEDYYPHWISHFYFNKCDDCSKRFPTKRALGQHRHAVHKNRQVKCDKCGKVLANKMSLDLHLLRHLPDSEKKKYMIKCKICKKKIAQWNLKSHLATHNDERPWKCDHCEATFKMKGALVSHRDVVHFNLKNHVCSLCGDAFKSASSLRGHVRRHEGRKDYKCEVCHKEYYTYSALKGHKVVHQTARDFICVTCGKAFKKKKALEEHVTLHTGEKPHRCPICGREIRVKSNLYKHMKIHKKAAAEGGGPAPSRKKSATVTSAAEAEQSDLNSTTAIVSGGSATRAANGTVTVTLDNGTVVSDMTPFVVSIVTAGADGIHSPTSVVELNSENHAQIINAVAVANRQEGGESTYSLTPHFQTSASGQSSLVQTLTMQHQHQDLLNVPLQAGHFYTTTSPQYFSTLDQLQN